MISGLSHVLVQFGFQPDNIMKTIIVVIFILHHMHGKGAKPSTFLVLALIKIKIGHHPKDKHDHHRYHCMISIIINISITTFHRVCTVSSIPVWCLSSAPLKTWPSLMIRKLVKTGKLPFQLTNVVHLWTPLVLLLSYLWSITYSQVR